MSVNKKFSLIFVFLVLVPLAASLVISSGMGIYYSHNRVLYSFLFLIPIISCVYIIRANYTNHLNNLLWYIISVVFGLGVSLFWYVANALSHFGF